MGTVKVTVQTEQRMEAITSMANAIYELSRALGVGTHVSLTGFNINNVANGPAVNICTSEDITETTIEEFDS